MHNIYYSAAANRIYITISGKIDDDEAVMYREKLKSLISLAEVNFTICINMIDAHIDMLENSGEYKDVREYAAAKKMMAVIHVLCNEHYNMHQKKPFAGITNASTSLKYAEEFLDNTIRKDES